MDQSEVCSSNDRFAISLQKDNDEKASSDGLHSKTPHLNLENQEYNAKMQELLLQLDMVRKMVRPGCSQEVLDVCLGFHGFPNQNCPLCHLLNPACMPHYE